MISTTLLAGALAIAPAPSTPDDLKQLSDEFTSGELSASWKRFDQVYGWPDKLKALDVDRTVPGTLHLQPYDSAWVRELNAPFLYKDVTGDFDVRARIRVRGKDKAIPGGTWSLGGLMVRLPNASRADAWQPRRENWHFITTGVGHEPGKPVTETKTTYNSSSHLKLRPFYSGWVELRLVRVGNAFFALARQDGGRWEVRDRFYRMDARPEVQVGLIAYTSSPDEPAGPDNPQIENYRVKKAIAVDMAMDIDWIRFSRPQGYRGATAVRSEKETAATWYSEVRGDNKLTDPNLASEDILASIGD